MKNIFIVLFFVGVLVVFPILVNKNPNVFYKENIPPIKQEQVLPVVPTTKSTDSSTALDNILENLVPQNNKTIMTAIDIKKTMVQSFNEDFNTLSLYTDSKGNTSCNPGGKGVWQTVYHFCSRTIPSNSEAQIYIDQNFISYMNSRASTPSNTEVPFSLKAGILSITAKPSDGALRLAAGSWAGYTSGLLTTEFSFSQTYGYFEIKAKLPKGEGVWPAFWLLPVDRSWPPEIDVVETFGGTNEKGEGGATHIHYASHLKEKSKSCGEWFDVQKNVTNGFHTYGVNWQPDKITYYFDNLPYASCPGSPEANKPFYMLVNLAVGGKGSWPGTTDESNVWPAIMQVDFIRAYKNK